jgi:hypothetical protein
MRVPQPVVVLVGGADIAAGFEIPHEADEVSGRAIAWDMHPVMARQPGLMG